MAKRSLGYVFTQHNWLEEEWQALEAAIKRDCRYAIMGSEICPDTGTPHIQGYIGFPEGKAKTFTAFKAWFDACLVKGLTPPHVLCKAAPARGTEVSNEVYCSKERARVFEHGVPLATPADKGEMEKDRAKRNLEAIADGRLEDVDHDIIAHHLRNYEYGAAALKRARRVPPKALDGVLDNVWVYGPRGSGKDTYVRGQLAERPYYLKSLEPYWDKYDDEEDVYIEDIDREALKVTRLLKIWTDRYPFDGRRMYGLGQCIIRPKRIWVTSQYHPKDLFNKEDAEAIIRRFRIVHMEDGVGRPERRQWTARPTPIILEEEAPAAPHPTPDPPSPDRFGLYLLD